MTRRDIVRWQPLSALECRVEIVGDSLLVIKAIRGQWQFRYWKYSQRIAQLHDSRATWLSPAWVLPSTDARDYHRHSYREHNCEADWVAALGYDGDASFVNLAVRYAYVRVNFDGSRRAAGWVAFGSQNPGIGDFPSTDEFGGSHRTWSCSVCAPLPWRLLCCPYPRTTEHASGVMGPMELPSTWWTLMAELPGWVLWWNMVRWLPALIEPQWSSAWLMYNIAAFCSGCLVLQSRYFSYECAALKGKRFRDDDDDES